MSILAQIHKFNVILHQIDYEDMAQEFHDWKSKDLKVLHLSYHRGRHYNSVRSRKDPGYGPAFMHAITHPLMKPEDKRAATEEAKVEEAKNEEEEQKER